MTKQGKNENLHMYLLRGFLLTLLFIGVAQLVISVALNRELTPLVENALGMEGLLSVRNLKELMEVVLLCMGVVMLRKYVGSAASVSVLLSNSKLGRIIDNDIVVNLNDLNERVSDAHLNIYIIKVGLLLLFVLLIWGGPYILGAIIYSRVVTRKVKEIERRRIERNKEFEKRRNLLLSDIAHDIKTPITTVAGFSKALADKTVPEDERDDYLEAVYKKSMKISDLVTLLFEYVKLDSEGYALKLSKQNMCELVRECVAATYEEFEEKDMDLDLDIPEEEIWADVDKLQMERAINNILSNTIKHNPNGTKVMIDMKKDGEKLLLTISDYGEKIDREVARHLFDPFVQGDESRNSKKGSGLGLSITKKIVQMHKGKIVLIQYLNPEKYGKVKSFEIMLPCSKNE